LINISLFLKKTMQKMIKRMLVATIAMFCISAVQAQSKVSVPDSTKKIQVVETSCGQCQFGMKEKKGCDLAVRIDGKAYFVEGTKIDDHGDAHAADGFCESIRKAETQGELVNDKFKVTYFKLIKKPESKKE
jgi:hypothetical protein